MLLAISDGRARTLKEVGIDACVSTARAQQVIESMRRSGAVVRIPPRFELSPEWRAIVERSRKTEAA